MSKFYIQIHTEVPIQFAAYFDSIDAASMVAALIAQACGDEHWDVEPADDEPASHAPAAPLFFIEQGDDYFNMMHAKGLGVATAQRCEAH